MCLWELPVPIIIMNYVYTLNYIPFNSVIQQVADLAIAYDIVMTHSNGRSDMGKCKLAMIITS